VVQIHHISILAPLAVGMLGQACTFIIHLLPVRATINLVRREKDLGRVGTPWIDLGIFARVLGRAGGNGLYTSSLNWPTRPTPLSAENRVSC